MEKEHRSGVFRWSRDLILAVVVIPGIMGMLGMTYFQMTIAGIATLAGLKIWENLPELRTAIGQVLAKPSHTPETMAASPSTSVNSKMSPYKQWTLAFLVSIPIVAAIVGAAYEAEHLAWAYEHGPNPVFFWPPSEAWKGRQFVNPPLARLASFYEQFTHAEADRLVAPYIGPWVAVYGVVDDDSTGPYESSVSLKGDSLAHERVQLYFKAKWNNQIAPLEKGAWVAAYCQVSFIYSGGAELHDCEFAPLPKNVN